MLFLAAVVGVALIGGIYPALAAAVAGSLLLNYYFTPPLYEFAIAACGDVLALVVFVAVAVAVSRRGRPGRPPLPRSRRGRAPKQKRCPRSPAASCAADEPLAALLDRVRETFAHELGRPARTRRHRPADPGHRPRPGQVAGRGGRRRATRARPPTRGTPTIPVDEDLVLVLRGRALPAADRRVLETAAVQAARRLPPAAPRPTGRAEAVPLAEADRMRRALLTAVSHDLRTPLASATAAVDSLAGPIVWTPEQRAELFATARESLARLATLVENLLDMSRLQADAVGVTLRPIALDEAVPRALDSTDGAAAVILDVPDTLPEVQADPGLLERVLVNLLTNALRHSPRTSRRA